MRLIDLSSTLDPQDRDLLPPAMAAAAGVVAPRVDYSHPATPDGRERFCHFFGCSHDDLPDGEIVRWVEWCEVDAANRQAFQRLLPLWQAFDESPRFKYAQETLRRSASVKRAPWRLRSRDLSRSTSSRARSSSCVGRARSTGKIL